MNCVDNLSMCLNFGLIIKKAKRKFVVGYTALLTTVHLYEQPSMPPKNSIIACRISFQYHYGFLRSSTGIFPWPLWATAEYRAEDFSSGSTRSWRAIKVQLWFDAGGNVQKPCLAFPSSWKTRQSWKEREKLLKNAGYITWSCWKNGLYGTELQKRDAERTLQGIKTGMWQSLQFKLLF